MDMMKIEEVVGDLILIVLHNHEPLQKIGIDQDKIFVRVKQGPGQNQESRSLHSYTLGLHSVPRSFSRRRGLRPAQPI